MQEKPEEAGKKEGTAANAAPNAATNAALKKFVACIYLKNGKANRNLKDSRVVSDDPVALAKTYADGGVDAILIFDQSENDEEHEQAIGILRSICGQVKVPIYGAGHVNRLEDVKKLIYAGCAKAALNFSKESNLEMLKEAAERFGKDRIAACYRAADAIHAHKDEIVNYVDELVLIDETDVRNALKLEEVPSILTLPEISLDKVLEFGQLKSVSGISGNAINDNIELIADLKKLCMENGITVSRHKAKFSWKDFKKDPQGLVPVVVQEASTGEVLMVAYMNEEAYDNTVSTGRMTYWSRSRQSLWIKGETSGHFQYVRSLTADCDMDTILAKVDQIGAACHTGSHSCFFQTDLVLKEEDELDPMKVLERDYRTITDRREHPKEGSYTNYLFDKGIDKMLKKLGEECTEVVIAAKNTDSTEVVYEVSDLLYHLMVVMAQKNVTWKDITEELVRRAKNE